MISRTLVNLALLVIVLILVAVVIFEPGKTPRPKPELLTSMKSSDVKQIKIIRRHKGTIELKKQSAHWRMLKPFNLPANNYKVESVLNLLQTESIARYDLTDLDPARYDLVTPAVSILFNNSLKIDFGNIAPLQKQRYVRIGKQLHLIPDYYYYQLVGSATDYLDHALIPEGKKIVRLELPDLTLALKGGKWTLSPENKDYSADAYTDLLKQWKHAIALELRPLKDKNKKNTAHKQIHIFLRGNDKPINYTLLHTRDKFILIRADKNIEYVMPKNKAATLLHLQKSTPDTTTTQKKISPGK